MENSILYQFKNHVGYIRLNRPESGNKIDLPLAQELKDICTQINLDEEVYLTVISGSNGIFSLGGDIREWITSADSPELLSITSPAEAVAGLNCPVIAALNGDALGPGLELALSGDIRFASSNARFGLTQITEGYIPQDGGTQRLPRIVGKGKALEMVLTGEIIDAQTALEIGLVNQVINELDFTAWIESEAEKIAAKAPLAMRYIKEAVNQGLDLPLAQGLRLEADLYFLLHTTEDRTEGIRSFLEKRPPHYKGK
jgi:enoyl-CoA hydratase